MANQTSGQSGFRSGTPPQCNGWAAVIGNAIATFLAKLVAELLWRILGPHLH